MRSCSFFDCFRRRDRHQLDLVELVLADHAARVLAGRARFGAEARRVGGEPQRQLGFLDDRFAHEIGQRDFGGGDEPEASARRHGRSRSNRRLDLASQHLALRSAAELIVLELRQLRRAVHHLVAHQQRRRDFGVAVLGRVHDRRRTGRSRAPCARARFSARRSARPTVSRRSRNPSGRALRPARNAASARTDSCAWRRSDGARRCRSRPCRRALRRTAGSGSRRALSSSSVERFFSSASSAGIVSFSCATSAISCCARRLVLVLLRRADLLRGRVAPRLRMLRPSGSPRAASRRARAASRIRRQPAPRRPRVEGVGVVANPFDVVHGGLARNRGLYSAFARQPRRGACILRAARDGYGAIHSSRARPPQRGRASEQAPCTRSAALLRRLGAAAAAAALAAASAAAFFSTKRTDQIEPS